MYQDEIKAKRQTQSDKQNQERSVKTIWALSREIRLLLNSLEKTGAKKLDKDFIKAVASLRQVAEAMANIKVTSDEDLKAGLQVLIDTVASIDVKPVVNVEPAQVNVQERKLDLKPIIRAIEKIEAKAEVNIDTQAFTDSVDKVREAINGLQFPVANFILPFKDPATGKATQITLTSDGKLPAETTVDTTGLATEAEQQTQTTHLSAIETAVEAIQAAQLPDSHNVTIDNASIAVTGTFWQATQPVSGTVTANLGATDNGVLDSIDEAVSSKQITGIGHGVKTITSAGTDEALAGSTACKKVTIQAQTDNTGLIAVGATGVDATEATGTGIILRAGDSFEFDIDNLADVFIDATVNGEGVRYAYFT